MPNSLIAMQGFRPISDKTAQFLDTIYNNGNGKDEYGGIAFEKWFCGHFHKDKQMAPKVNCLYSDYKVLLSERIREAEADYGQLEYE